MTKQETQKYTIDLAVLLYLDLPFWKRWLIRRKFAERTVTPQGWKDCLQMAYYMIRDAKAISYVAYVEDDKAEA